MPRLGLTPEEVRQRRARVPGFVARLVNWIETLLFVVAGGCLLTGCASARSQMGIGIDETGSRVSIVTGADGEQTLWIVNLLTMRPVKVASHYSIDFSSISSAGNLIAYSYRESEGAYRKVRIRNLSDGSREDISVNSRHCLFPSLSGDGSKIVYAIAGERINAWGGLKPTDYSLVLVDRRTGKRKTLEEGPVPEIRYPCLDTDSGIVTYYRERFRSGPQIVEYEMCRLTLETGQLSVREIAGLSVGGRWIDSVLYFDGYIGESYRDSILRLSSTSSQPVSIYDSGKQFDGISWSTRAPIAVGLEQISGRRVILHVVNLETGEVELKPLEFPDGA